MKTIIILTPKQISELEKTSCVVVTSERCGKCRSDSPLTLQLRDGVAVCFACSTPVHIASEQEAKVVKKKRAKEERPFNHDEDAPPKKVELKRFDSEWVMSDDEGHILELYTNHKILIAILERTFGLKPVEDDKRGGKRFELPLPR